MGLKEDFDKAAEEAKGLPDNTSNDDKLALYGLFKQASVGDNTTDRPGFFDPKGKAKWDAWKKEEGKSKEQAMQEYIELVAQLKAKYAA
jgi:diazepam-binding inhibitor (GABA receptor modulating acyl-CoA-binding protein)